MKTKNMEKIKKLAFNLACILCPSITLLLIWPIARELPPMMITQNLNVIHIYLGASYWVGVFSAPGFLYFLFREDISGSGKCLKRWVGVSLHAAFYASFAGLTSIWFIFPGPFAVGTLLCTGFVLQKYKAQKVPV
ncbi:MAG: hypothetical protein V3R14_03405 [Nitrospinaceae bacterium]